ncbi:hypothetical protein K503DRAFT_770684 [Rhizopogon vinicolor AM-OR11-026]|uniref:Transmembrane protein n=1 Tax=Rhizopogon vinicolor AM-OR11-026 TaxID=1314800 RepID=A0A1B7N0A7_9AGAM|nr:hypothetical protein K503DRAFT_770684 [Rhizopogon vinicolor AM-OR11-026]
MSHSVEPEAVALSILIVTTTLSGLMVLEYAWNIRFEVQVIWRRFWKSAEVKVFVVARYVGLAGQIFNVWFASRMASGIPSSPAACRVWFMYQTIAIQSLTMSVEALLILRVCKMYNNDKYILGILSVFGGAQCAGMGISALMVVPSLGSSPTCTVIGTHPGQIYVGVSTVAMHLCILAMILWRYFRGNWQEPLRSYFKIMVRDSICAAIAVTGCFLFLTLVPIGLSQSAAQTSENILFHVMVCSFWFAAGRLVLDKERFRQQSRNNREFTEVDLEDLGSDSDVSPARLSNSKAVPIEVSIAADFEPGVGKEKDIADERLYDWADTSLSRCVSSIMHMDIGSRVEGSGSTSNLARFTTQT